MKANNAVTKTIKTGMVCDMRTTFLCGDGLSPHSTVAQARTDYKSPEGFDPTSASHPGGISGFPMWSHREGISFLGEASDAQREWHAGQQADTMRAAAGAFLVAGRGWYSRRFDMAGSDPKADSTPNGWRLEYITYSVVDANKQKLWWVTIFLKPTTGGIMPADMLAFWNANYQAANAGAANGLAMKLAEDDGHRAYTNWQEGTVSCTWSWEGYWKPTYFGLP